MIYDCLRETNGFVTPAGSYAIADVSDNVNKHRLLTQQAHRGNMATKNYVELCVVPNNASTLIIRVALPLSECT
jgi:hypothetical protein